MKISFNWLKEYIQIDKDVEEVSDLLTQAGLEVEGVEKIESIPGGLAGLVVGKVVSCEQHPNADKLKLTTIDIGKEEVLDIVCGAPNVAKDQLVIVATIGTTLYPTAGDSFKIKKSKIRGELSEGMLCGEDEIGIGSSHEGIIVLENQTPGTPAKEVFNVEDDFVIEIGLTPNRVDAASHIGVARDLAVILNSKITRPDVLDIPTQQGPVSVEVKNTNACQRYSSLTIKGLTVTESPDWLKARLRAIGLEPINNVVDCTNYVLHETGQPLHAFDLSKIANSKVSIQTVAVDTPFTPLDGKQRKLLANNLVICDGNKTPLCLAGIIGGLDSGTTTTTTDIFLESAYFNASSVRKTSLQHGIKTDSAFRFERGADPEATLYALKRAASLILEIAGGSIDGGLSDWYPTAVSPFNFTVSLDTVDRIIGVAIPEREVERILTKLEIDVTKASPREWRLSVPSYRVDVQREIDIIEEIARFYGYNNIPEDDSISTQFMSPLPANDENRILNSISDFLAANGFNEIVTNSLTKSNYADQLKEIDSARSVLIHNQLSEDLDALRQSMLFNGLEIIAYNINRKQSNLSLFEIGKTYHSTESGHEERRHLSLFLSGDNHDSSWKEASRKANYYDLATIVSNVFTLAGVKNYKLQESTNSISGQLAQLVNHQGDVFAEIGEVDTKLLKKNGIKQATVYADINLDLVLGKKVKKATVAPISKFPEVKRDLSLVLNKNIRFEAVIACAQKAERKLIKDIIAFDVYEGDKIDSDKKAYALSFILHNHEKTLTDEMIDKSMNKLMASFESELDAIIRK